MKIINRYSSILLVLILLGFAAASDAQNQVDYSAKALNKQLEKSWSCQMDDLVPIDVDVDMPLEGQFFALVRPDTKYLYVGRVNSCRAGGCSLGKQVAETNGTSEYFDYFIFFDADAKVELVKVFNYAATHGHEVMAKGWLKQFAGYNKSLDLKVGKNVDSISGATISVNAITEDIHKKANLMGQYLHLKVMTKK